ncbi:MAG: GNAT family N-acetyltransferase [Anaerolineae bacterium]|nr:GNAT family N-acetyltransferase [Anaerolineae bacterium]
MEFAFKLRPATVEDVGVIRVLIVQARINPTGLDWRRFVVAEDGDGNVIGCGQVKPHRDGSHELASIVVEEAWRGQGVARAMIEHLLAGHTGTLYLMCRSSLGPLYEKFGFSNIEADEMPKYFRRVSQLAGLADMLRKDGETLLVMQRGQA